MKRDCNEPSKEELGKPVQAGEDSQMPLNLSEEYTYRNVEGFQLFSLVFEEIINEPEMIGANTTGIERRIIGGTDKH